MSISSCLGVAASPWVWDHRHWSASRCGRGSGSSASGACLQIGCQVTPTGPRGKRACAHTGQACAARALCHAQRAASGIPANQRRPPGRLSGGPAAECRLGLQVAVQDPRRPSPQRALKWGCIMMAASNLKSPSSR